MALGSFFSNLFQKTPETEAPEGTSRATEQPAAAESGEAKIRRRLAVEQAVNEAMAAAGVETSHYKQYSRRADSAAQRLHVMIDLGRELAEVSVSLLSQVAASIVQHAKAKGQAEIAAVYWRLDAVAGAATPVNLVRQAIADKTDPGEESANAPAQVVAAAPSAAAKVATSEKIAKLRAMMGDTGPPGGEDPSYEKTQVIAKKGGGGDASFEKTQVLHVTGFQATQVMDESKDDEAGKPDKPGKP